MNTTKLLKSFLIIFSLTLAGCSSASDDLFSKSSSSSSSASKEDLNTNSSTYITDGTFFKKKIPLFKEELNGIKAMSEKRKQSLEKMRTETNASVADYKNTVAEINSKLQVGTTPGNPELLDKWRVARAKLEKVNNTAFDMKRLAADVDSDASMTDYMIESIGASYKVKGATEADHRELKLIEEETKQLSGSIAGFSRQIETEADRQQDYVEREKNNLNELALAIKNGRLYGYDSYGASDYHASEYYSSGTSLFGSDNDAKNNAAYGNGRGFGSEPVSLVKPRMQDKGRPLVVIKFDNDDVKYEEPLYQAVSRALERDASASFEVVAVSPRRYSSSAMKNATEVSKSLTEMGLPASRMNISSEMGKRGISSDEVHVYYVK